MAAAGVRCLGGTAAGTVLTRGAPMRSRKSRCGRLLVVAAAGATSTRTDG